MVDIITQLDLSGIYGQYAPVGEEAFAPEPLLITAKSDDYSAQKAMTSEVKINSTCRYRSTKITSDPL